MHQGNSQQIIAFCSIRMFFTEYIKEDVNGIDEVDNGRTVVAFVDVSETHILVALGSCEVTGVGFAWFLFDSRRIIGFFVVVFVLEQGEKVEFGKIV